MDKSLEADVALERPDAGVDQHVSLQVGRQCKLSGAHVTLELFHALGRQKESFILDHVQKTQG